MENKSTITEEMREFFEIRTKEHIERVVKNMEIMDNYLGLEKSELIDIT